MVGALTANPLAAHPPGAFTFDSGPPSRSESLPPRPESARGATGPRSPEREVQKLDVAQQPDQQGCLRGLLRLTGWALDEVGFKRPLEGVALVLFVFLGPLFRVSARILDRKLGSVSGQI